MLRPQFIKSQVSHVNRLEPHFKLLQKNITAQKDKYFDIQTLFFRFTLDTATEFLFGQSVHSLNDGENSLQFSEAFTKSQAILATRANLHELYFLADGIKFRQYNKMVQDFSQRCVDKVLNMSNSEIDQSDRYVFLYEMVKITRNPQVLRDQCLNILLAGRDTTASLLSFAIFELALNEPIWIKLRTEVLHVFQTSSELITFDLLKIKCPYLQAILHETLRLYPSVPRNARFAKKNTTLPHGGGVDGMSPILIKKGQPVAYFICATHVDEKFYTKDALVFRPERWCEEPLIKKNLAWSYLPFNGGPRICLGQQFALTEASYVLARLAQCYTKISLQPNSFEYPPKKQVHLTMSLLDGVHVKMSNLSIS
ncbi:CYP52D1 Cytochrome P450 52D1 [Candida maltosa Xu316]